MKRLFVGALVFVMGTAVACANSVSLGVSTEEDASTPPSFTPPDAEVDAGGDVAVPRVLACVATECEAPFGTCSNSKWRCDINLDNDPQNCGGCGVTCPPAGASADVLNMAFTCVAGKCEAACAQTIDIAGVVRYSDCNKVIDDGCEVRLGTKSNCGGCGEACPGDLSCVNFQCTCTGGLVPSGDTCVCPAGTVSCPTPWGGTECVDLATSDSHCGVCGNRCTTTPVSGVPNTYMGCMGGACDQKRCNAGWFDCDGDQANGCESLINTDKNNCGACGNKCADGQQCFRGECVCAQGTFCTNVCVDLETDAMNCGRCGDACPGMTRQDAAFWSLPSPHGAPSCAGGRCDYTCDQGWADCDQDIENGCESDVMTNPFQCGGCNIRCDVEAGQVCSRGKCLMRECEEGEVR